MLTYFVLIFLFYKFLPFLAQMPTEETEYTLNYASDVYVCSDEASQSLIDTSGIRAARISDNEAILTGHFEFKKKVDKGVVVELLLAKEGLGGRYEVVATHDMCDFCDEVSARHDGTFYSSYFAPIDLPDACPIEAGVYKINDMITDTDDFPIDATNAGRYEATINLYFSPTGDCKQDLEFLGCMKLDLLIEPI